MEGYFKRERDKNYLVFEKEQANKNYKYKMLDYYNIQGILPCESYCINNKIRLQYDISSKQSLQCICEKKQVNTRRFEKLLQGILEVITQLDRYFLDVDELCFAPKYIYMDMESFHTSFCYDPNKERCMAQEEFHQLSEYLINHLDYEDKELIERGYQLYRLTSQDNYSIQESIQRVCLNLDSELTKEKNIDGEWSEDVDIPQEDTENAQEKLSEGGIWNNLFHKWKNEFVPRAEKTEIGEEGPVLDSVTELEEPQPEEVYGHTVLLKEDKEKPLHYLVALSEGGYEDFSITKYPFVIGKGREWSDGVIPHELVSRIHAQLEERDEGIFLTDLNSTNGTVVNEQQLEANDSVLLNSGDIIGFAEVYYRFV